MSKDIDKIKEDKKIKGNDFDIYIYATKGKNKKQIAKNGK